MISHSAKETLEFARKFAKKLRGGEIIGLIGDLGSGKTVFTKGLAKGLGIKETITSPTFVLLKEYDILRPKPHLAGAEKRLRKLIHIDAYRVESAEEILSTGIGDYFGRDDVVLVIEWAEKIKDILPKDVIYINFETTGENSRKIEIGK